MPPAFTIQIGTVELPAPSEETLPTPLPAHVIDITDAHSVVAHQLTDSDVWLYTVSLRDLSDTQKIALRAFHATQGLSGTWTYVMSNGQSILGCKFADPALQFGRNFSTSFDVQLRFYGPPMELP